MSERYKKPKRYSFKENNTTTTITTTPDRNFSSPIISPNSELGYYLHVPPFDHASDQSRLAIASLETLKDPKPKVYEIRPPKQQEKEEQEEATSELFTTHSVNSSNSSFEQVKVAERQIIHTESPSTYNTWHAVYEQDDKRYYYFNKLQQIMEEYEHSDSSSGASSPETSSPYMSEEEKELKQLENYYSICNGLSENARMIIPPTRNSSISYYYATQRDRNSGQSFQDFDCSNIARYTLVDTDLSYSKSTSSNYHQRLNEYDDKDSHNQKDTDNMCSVTPLPPSYNSTLKPRLLTSPYYDYSSSSNNSGSRTSKGSSNFGTDTTRSDYSIIYAERSQRLLEEAGYSPRRYFNIRHSAPVYLEELEEKKSPIYLPSPPSSIQLSLSSSRDLIDKPWRPYFTYTSTLVMIAYFVACLVKNHELTGTVIQLSPFNVMIGPSAETLIYTGARFAPCIRASSLYPVTDAIYNCPYTKTSTTTTKPYFNDQSFTGIFSPNVTADSNECDLQQVCGGTTFRAADKPDQVYRFISALFMHSGVVQLVINLLVHLRLSIRVEQRINPFRYGIIWVVSGVFGYVFGSLFVPVGNVSVGCSVSLMGILAFLFLDLMRNWMYIAQPKKVLCSMIAYFAITLAIGLLPGYDNFSHFGGFIGGIVATLLVSRLPWKKVPAHRFTEQRVIAWIMRIIALAFLVVLLWMLLYLFIHNNGKSCHACQYFSCLPISDLCSPYY